MMGAMDSCAECGFRYDDLDVSQIATTIHSFAARYHSELVGIGLDQSVCARRPEPAVWSVLEYLCHIRDVLLVQRDRAVWALAADRPTFPPMYREERVELLHYAQQPVEHVVTEVMLAAHLCATVFDGLSAEQLDRRLVYNYPTPTERDIAWLGRHTVHEGEHHLLDVRRVAARVS